MDDRQRHHPGRHRAADQMMDADLAVEQRQPPEAEQRQAVRIDRLADDLGDEIITRADADRPQPRSEEHTSELQSLMRISYAVFCLKKKKTNNQLLNSIHLQLSK